MKKRKYLPTVSELIDRLCILQLKEVFIPEHKEDLYVEEVDGNLIRSIIVLAQINLHIWHNEAGARTGKGKKELELTHGLNGIRNTAKNKIQNRFGGRKDHKVDCLAAEFKDWEISWD